LTGLSGALTRLSSKKKARWVGLRQRASAWMITVYKLSTHLRRHTVWWWWWWRWCSRV